MTIKKSAHKDEKNKYGVNKNTNKSANTNNSTKGANTNNSTKGANTNNTNKGANTNNSTKGANTNNSTKDTSKLIVKLKIRRFDAAKDKESDTSKYDTFELEVEKGTTLLQCLDEIKWQHDPSLTYRRNCKNSICGSCSMKVNKRTKLACETQVHKVVETFCSNEILVEPMGNMKPVKDLVVDMGNFWQALYAVKPWLITDNSDDEIPEKEYTMTKETAKKLDAVASCIMCGACYSDCNSLEVEKKFLGPAALARALRYIDDSRDSAREQRIKELNKISKHGIWDCTHCFECIQVCPMKVAPMEQILKIRQYAQISGMTHNPGARHHKAFSDSVKKAGWLNEVTLPIKSVGLNIVGFFQLAPVGMRMYFKGKMPEIWHKPIANVNEIKNIYMQLEEDEMNEGLSVKEPELFVHRDQWKKEAEDK